MKDLCDTEHIADAVRYVRKEVLNMSQEEFGYQVGISKDTVSNIECGSVPSMKTMVSIANLASYPMDFFLHTREE